MVLLIGAGVSNAQDFETIKNFTLVYYNEKYMYLVNIKEAKIDKTNVVFTGMKADMLGVPGIPDAITPSKENHEFIVFTANCDTFEYSPMRVYGKMSGQPYKYPLKPEIFKATPNTVIHAFINEVCTNKIGEQLNIERKTVGI
jgi:hypothetical protein